MTSLTTLRSRIPAIWAGKSGPLSRSLLACTAPLEWGFRGAVWGRDIWYSARGGAEAPLPVVSVGNLTVGGAGKTPLLKALWTWIEGQGARAAVVTRGYGADEVALYQRWFGVDRVFVSPTRIDGVRQAKKKGLSLALIDDGFQHRSLNRDLDILLVAAEDPFPVRLLPRGPYREPLHAAARASLILVTNRTKTPDSARWRERLGRAAPGAEVADIVLGGSWSAGEGGAQPTPDAGVLALASTASPWTFATTVEELAPGSAVELMPFPDHHEYSQGDVARILETAKGRTIATTEKDAVKVSAFPEMRERYRVIDFGVVGDLPNKLTGALAEILRGAT